MKEKVESARFAARDGAGRIFTIIAYQYLPLPEKDDGRAVIGNGELEYWTDTGLPVGKIDSETFRIATCKETVTRFY